MSYHIKSYTDTFPIYKLEEKTTDSWVEICPERGGIVLSYGANGHELLYLDKETFYDPQANIRGGIPILFPISGSLPNGSYEWEGENYTMKNHGIARVLPWEVIETKEIGEASLTLRLRSNPTTLESFPFDFELIFTYVLKDAALHILQEYRNLSNQEMPMYAGLHPYFLADRKNIAYETDASRFLDLNDHKEKTFEGIIDLSKSIECVILLDVQKPKISFQPADQRIVQIKYSEEFKYIVIWSIPDKPFVCVEPWMAQPNEMIRKQELTMVQPNETLRAELVITCGA
jgi:galactose mutarotase-like enzyme